MEPEAASIRSAALAERLRSSAAALVDLVADVDDDAWACVSAAGVWSVGKEVEHVAEAVAYHEWIVRRTIGERVGSRRPPIERDRLTALGSARETLELLRGRTDEGVRLILGLTDRELDLPTRPPRAHRERLATTIERVMVGHHEVHRASIEIKILGLRDRS
jgi:hypothetical protein